MQPTQTKQRGFTLVEVLIIAPIVILLIGTFIGLAVSLTGESLQLREKNAASYDIQSALDQMESSVTQATGFLATTGTLSSPQGKDNNFAGTAEFINEVSGQADVDTLIIQSAATSTHPNDPNRSIVYTGGGSCDPKNPIYLITTIFFVKEGSLYKRTITPLAPACAAPYQKNSCTSSAITSNPTLCKVEDEKLVDAVSKIEIEYFQTSTSTPALSPLLAADANTISIKLTVDKPVAGSTVTSNGAVRATSLNTQVVDSSQAAVAVPQITFTQAAATPYTTTFAWQSLGNATGYNIRYKVGTGAWQNGPQNTQVLSYNVVGVHRKQTIDFELTTVTANGNFLYGTKSTTLPRWNECTYNTSTPLWRSYGAPYTAAGFTKTKAGIVGLRGLVAGGAIGNTICTLPPEFRPAERLIFQTAGYSSTYGNGTARVDIFPSGNVIAISGESPWVSLDGIAFVASGAGYTWQTGGWQNGWSDYLNTFSPLRHTIDSEGRVQVQGLGLAGTTGAITMANIGAAKGVTAAGIHMPSTNGTTGRGIVQVDINGNIIGRAGNGGYQSLQLTYYPSSFGGWKNMTFSAGQGWQNYAAGWPGLQCYKAADDLVVIRGLITRPAGPGDGTNISDTATAGCGRYDDGRLLLAGWMSNELGARIDIEGSTVSAQYTQPAWTSLDGLHFIAD